MHPGLRMLPSFADQLHANGSLHCLLSIIGGFTYIMAAADCHVNSSPRLIDIYI